MRVIVKGFIGIIYMLMKYITLVIAFTIVVIWYFDVKPAKELYKDFHIFYISYMFHSSFEQYRYNTLSDFIFDRKDYSHKWHP